MQKGSRRIRKGRIFNESSRKDKQKLIDSNNEYNLRWHSNNKNSQTILNYINKKKHDIDGVSAGETIEFNRLIKQYRGFKKYIFVIPEFELKSVLNHTYDLEKHKQLLERLLKKEDRIRQLRKTKKKPRYIRPRK